MTTMDVLGALRRRWLVVLVGLALTAGVSALVLNRPGVYTSEVDVVLIAPRTAPEEARTLIVSSDDLIAAAGLVERLVNAGTEVSAATNQDVSLEGTGVRYGSVVRLPNSGGQWNFNVTSPTLNVQVAASSRAAAVERRDTALTRISDVVREIQRGEGVPRNQMITLRVVPQQAPVVHAVGHPLRAAATAALICCLLTAVASVVIDRRLSVRAPTPQSAPDQGT